MPLLMALCVVVGILIGNFYANHFSGNRLNIINSGSNRLSNLLHIIDDQYVDKVNIDSLVNNAIPLILAELDPHSVYISAKDAQAANDDLKGSFTGIGVEFTIRQDTIQDRDQRGGNAPLEGSKGHESKDWRVALWQQEAQIYHHHTRRDSAEEHHRNLYA